MERGRPARTFTPEELERLRIDAQRVAVIIVTYNVREELQACLQSLWSGSLRHELHVTVVDNGSSDGTKEMLLAEWPGVRVIASHENLGFARASNVGIRATPAPLVLLLNPDTVVMPGAIDTLADALADRPDAAAAGPRLVDGNGRTELSFGWPMSPLGELRQKLVGALYTHHVPPLDWAVRHWTRVAGRRRWLSGACLLLHRADLEAVGLLDERFFMYAEDVDLGVMLARRGRDLLFVPGAQVLHLRGRSGARNPQLANTRRESQLAYYAKHHPRWLPALRWYLRLAHGHTTK